MKMAIIGLGRMGGNMARRLCRGGIEVVGYNRSQDIVKKLAAEEGMIPAASVAEAVAKPRRRAWCGSCCRAVSPPSSRFAI